MVIGICESKLKDQALIKEFIIIFGIVTGIIRHIYVGHDPASTVYRPSAGGGILKRIIKMNAVCILYLAIMKTFIKGIIIIFLTVLV